jgi:hypothetical protein
LHSSPRHAAPGRFLRAWQLGTEEVDLGASAARTGIAHLPEVVRRTELADAFNRKELAPGVERLLVTRDPRFAFEDGREQPIGGEAPDLGQQRPGEGDGVTLEVVAKGEVPQHLEERVMPERRPDVVEVVVLAADAHALLGAGRRAV